MPLGPDVAEWSALAAALAQLADRAGAANACVTDAWGHLWCRARAFSFPEQQRVLALARQLVEQAPAPLARGGRIDRSERTEHGAYAARSFAGVYVVLLLFRRPDRRARRAARDARAARADRGAHDGAAAARWARCDVGRGKAAGVAARP